MTEKFSNNAQTTLSASLTNSATSLTVTSATAFPTTGEFRILIEAEGSNTDEILTVTAVSGTTFTVTRASESTAGVQTASAHASGATVKHVLTAGALNIASTGFIGAKAYHNTTQTGAGVRSLNSEEFDTDGFHDISTNNSRMTIPAGLGGKYLCRGYVWGGTDKLVRILKNGSTVTGSNVLFKTGGECSLILDLISTDYVEVYTDDTGATGHASAVEAMNSLELMKLDSGKVGSGIGATVWASATQSVGAGATDVVLFDSEDFDTDGFHSTSSNTGRFTIPAGLGGKYLLIYHVHVPSETGSNPQIDTTIRKNGGTSIRGSEAGSSITGAPDLPSQELVGHAFADLAAGDYVDITCYTIDAISIGQTSSGIANTFSIMRLDALPQSGPNILLNYTQSSDISAVSFTAVTWTDIIANQTFTKLRASSVIEIAVRGSAFFNAPAIGQIVGTRVVIDSAGTSITEQLGGGSTAGSANLRPNVFAGGASIFISGLATGAHTIKPQGYCSETKDFYLRPSEATEFLRIQVIEHGG